MDVVCTSGWGTSRPASGGACTANKVLPETAKNLVKDYITLAWLQLSVLTSKAGDTGQFIMCYECKYERVKKTDLCKIIIIKDTVFLKLIPWYFYDRLASSHTVHLVLFLAPSNLLVVPSTAEVDCKLRLILDQV